MTRLTRLTYFEMAQVVHFRIICAMGSVVALSVIIGLYSGLYVSKVFA